MLIDENVNGRIIRNLYSRRKRGGVREREHRRENGGLGARDEKGTKETNVAHAHNSI